MYIFTREEMDYVSFTLLAAAISIAITVYYFSDKFVDDCGNTVSSFDVFLGYIEFDALLFIVCMQIVVALSEKHKIFQWVALKALHFTKGDHRKFFYVICFVAALSSAVISDITVGIIFVPLVIRACRILKIDATPFLFGLSFTINIGSIYTPFSSSENILIAASFGKDLIWFLKHFSLIVFPILFLTLYLLDRLMLKKINPPEEEQKKILLEIMHPELVIVDKKQFVLNSGYFIGVIIAFLFIEQAYVVAAMGAILISLLNKTEFTESLKQVDWKLISFFIGIFIIMGTMQVNGTFTIIKDFVSMILSDNLLLAAITVLFLISILSGFLAQIPTALVFITILDGLYDPVPNIIVMALLLGINIGSNFLPQGAACDLITLNLAEKNGVKGFNYKTLLVNGSKMTLIHLMNSVIYLSIYYVLIL